MNVTTEQKENCILDLHIELPPDRFNQEWKRIAGEYVRLARIPGFRKGKAPLGPGQPSKASFDFLRNYKAQILNSRKCE